MKLVNSLYVIVARTCHGVFGNHLSFDLLKESSLRVVEIVFSHGK